MSGNISIGRFSTALETVVKQAPDSPSPTADDPGMRILKQLKEKGMIPVSDLPDLTRLSPDECLNTVEKLRERSQVEIVENPTVPDVKFIRLTTAGYAVFAA